MSFTAMLSYKSTDIRLKLQSMFIVLVPNVKVVFESVFNDI